MCEACSSGLDYYWLVAGFFLLRYGWLIVSAATGLAIWLHVVSKESSKRD